MLVHFGVVTAFLDGLSLSLMKKLENDEMAGRKKGRVFERCFSSILALAFGFITYFFLSIECAMLVYTEYCVNTRVCIVCLFVCLFTEL